MCLAYYEFNQIIVNCEQMWSTYNSVCTTYAQEEFSERLNRETCRFFLYIRLFLLIVVYSDSNIRDIAFT